MHVQVALQVGELDQSRQRALAGRLELAPVLAQLGRDPGVAEVLVDLLLVGSLERLVALDVKDAVLADREAAADRVLAQRDVVVLRAR